MPLAVTEMSADVRALTDRLLATPVGQVATYAELSEAIGADVLKRRYLVLAAIRAAARDAGALFSSVKGIGYKRVHIQDVYALGSRARQKVRRGTKRTADQITRALAFANDVPDEVRRKTNGEVNALQLLHHLSTDRAQSHAPKSDKPEPVGKVLRAMLDKLGAAPPE